MHLLLIRHGESVDNVAGLYAGSRDSPLTNHGVLQARRLGAHLASRRDAIGPVTHVLTSNLQRAYRTAEAIAEAQREAASNSDKSNSIPKLVQLTELREKDFGSAEGVKYRVPSTGRADGSIQSDSETREAMMIRVNRFISTELTSLLDKHVSEKVTVVIVAHGIILGTLLRALTVRFPARTATAASSDFDRQGVSWSNTGVLQAKFESVPGSPAPNGIADRTTSPEDSIGECIQSSSSHDTFMMTVQATNNTDHLNGLRKTRGGIGSAQFDARQQPLTAFFTSTAKKRKAEDDAS
ncbi:phosphoglycerate mutase family protein [Seiridium cupressi]